MFRVIRTWATRLFIAYLLVRAYWPDRALHYNEVALQSFLQVQEGVMRLVSRAYPADHLRADVDPDDLAALAASRHEMGKYAQLLGAAGVPDGLLAAVEDKNISGVRCVVMTPFVDDDGTEAAGPDNLAAGVLHIHGGGWVLFHPEDTGRTTAELAAHSRAVVVSVDYRLAPEHKFPAGLDDVFAVLEWVVANGHELGIDTSRLVLAGTSAGGNLAAAVLLRAQQTAPHLTDHVRGLVLDVPVTDVNYALYESTVQYATGSFLSATKMLWFTRMYLNTPAEASNPLVSPMLADDSALALFPPTLVVTAEVDMLRDQGEAFAAKLLHAGVNASVTRYNGTMHAFAAFPLLGQWQAANHQMATFMRHVAEKEDAVQEDDVAAQKEDVVAGEEAAEGNDHSEL